MSTAAAFLRLPSAMQLAKLWNRAVTWNTLVPRLTLGTQARHKERVGTAWMLRRGTWVRLRLCMFRMAAKRLSIVKYGGAQRHTTLATGY
jgi:hypothetical protein